ncbi:MAG TPA: hypothetical protein VM389_10905 [Phycisphaerae bacterium]|nr:hypothetical protein [Phycisphaerae bacterium]HUU23030.1 hypothetical protein [Phycisphaerae bacterium]
MMKLLVLAILLAAMFVAGCGMADMSISERQSRYKASVQSSSRMINDDWDFFWMVDRPSYRTYWYARGAGG